MISMKDLMKTAYLEKFAVPAINVEDVDVLEGVIKGASQISAPVIIQLTEPTVRMIDPEYIVYIINYLERKYHASVVVHLDHASSYELIDQCIKAGFSSIMVDFSDMDLEKNIDKCNEILGRIERENVAIELEIGLVGNSSVDSKKTIVKEAIQFINSVHCDMLAVSIGNSHGGDEKERRLDFALLSELNMNLGIPLVLHGSSGVVDRDISNASQWGICKVNIETEFRKLYRETIEPYFRDSGILKPRMIREALIEGIARKTVEKCKITGCQKKFKA